jgi:glyoxylase-like metal-dependent hydrolase (beta-lactamase superfamily II)
MSAKSTMKFSRRSFLQTIAVAGAASGISFLSPSVLSTVRAQNAARIGRLYTLDKGAIKVHSYIAPDASVSVTSHLIETANNLIVIDAQFLQTFAAEVRAIADAVGKPVQRLILSHAHPDHFLGANLWEGVPFVTTAGIAAGLDGYIEAGSVEQVVALVGETEVPTEVRPAEVGIEAGDETIDGVTFNYEIITDAEAPEHLIVRIPEAGVIVLNDLLYSNMHFFPGQNRDNWITVLEQLRGSLEGFDTLLPGHGLPATRGEIDGAIDYLTFVQETAASASSGQDIIDAVQAEYPGYEGTGILPFWNQFFQAQ